jgi:hypothetical protein
MADTLVWAEKYLTLENEANAALHMNERVFYSPLTAQVHECNLALTRVLSDLAAEDA